MFTKEQIIKFRKGQPDYWTDKKDSYKDIDTLASLMADSIIHGVEKIIDDRLYEDVYEDPSDDAAWQVPVKAAISPIKETVDKHVEIFRLKYTPYEFEFRYGSNLKFDHSIIGDIVFKGVGREINPDWGHNYKETRKLVYQVSSVAVTNKVMEGIQKLIDKYAKGGIAIALTLDSTKGYTIKIFTPSLEAVNLYCGGNVVPKTLEAPRAVSKKTGDVL